MVGGLLTVGGQAIMCSSIRSVGFGEDEELPPDEMLEAVLHAAWRVLA